LDVQGGAASRNCAEHYCLKIRKGPTTFPGCQKAGGHFRYPGSATASVVARKALNLYLNETAPRWEDTRYSGSLRPTSFALASRQQSLAQTAPLARATNLRIKANRVPFPAASFKSLYPKGRNGLR